MGEEDPNDDSRSLVSQRDGEKDNGAQFGFTSDQHKALLSLLKNIEKHQHHIVANQVATTSISDPGYSGSGIICSIANVFKSKQWILNTDATDHICFTLS